jgi:ABC-type multidrug transport system permease subunit
MIKLFELIKKNFKLLVRAKVSALVIFIGPLLLVSLLGLAYSQSSNFTLTSAVYSPTYSELSESLITKMTNQNFRVMKQESLENCVGSVKRGESQACVVFPAVMEITDGQSSEITFYVDYSQINLVWLMLDVMSARVSERSEEISQEITGDILDRMWFIEEQIKKGQSTMTSIKVDSGSIKNASGSTRSGMKKLDISVDFSDLDVDSAKQAALRVSALLEEIKANVSGLPEETRSAFKSIEGSVGVIEGSYNDSTINAEIDDIDDAADEIQDAIEAVIEDVDMSAENASAYLAVINSSFTEIGQNLADTQSKISSVKKKRDDLLPELERISSDIDRMSSSIDSLQLTLQQALEKIVALKGKDAASIVSPITTKIEPVTTQKTHFNSLFPTLLALIIMITGILLSTALILVEKKSKAFFRNNFTPTSYFTFNLSTYLTSLIVLFVQLLLFVSVSAFFFETEVLASIWLILLLVFIISTVFICIGMFIGYIFKTEETANLAAITLATIFLLFSNAVIPLESLPSYLKDIAMFSPFVASELALKQTIIFQLGFTKIMHGLGLLAAYAIVIFGLLVLLQNVLRRLTFVQFSTLHLGRVIVKDKKADIKFVQPGGSRKKDINELAVKEENRPKSPDKPGKTKDSKK